MSSSGQNSQVRLVTEKLRSRLLFLKLRKELTRADYSLGKSILDESALVEKMLHCSPKVGTIMIAANHQVLRLMKSAKLELPKEWYLLPVTVTPRMTCFSSEMVRNVADEFGVLLRKLFDGIVSEFPDVISLGATLHFDNTRFPGSMTWMLRYCPFITIPDGDVWITCNMVKAHSLSDRFTACSAELKLTIHECDGSFDKMILQLTDELLSYHHGHLRLKEILDTCFHQLSAE